MNPYELRYSIFRDASDTLHRHWQARMDHAATTAQDAVYSIPSIDPPTFDEIKAYADKMLEFVNTKG